MSNYWYNCCGVPGTATDGDEVVLSPNGDELADAYLRTHYARHGNLDDIIYFDCAEWLPAVSFFDVRRDLAAGVPSTTAVENRVDHFVEILVGMMGEVQFNSAVRSPSVVRYLAKTGVDAERGDDAFLHADLLQTAVSGAVPSHRPAVQEEMFNDVGTVIGGPVPADRQLTERLGSGRMDAHEVGTRLRALERGEWLFSLPAAFGDTLPRPFQVESLPMPPGVRDAEYGSSDEGFERARAELIERTRASFAIDVPEPELGEDATSDLDPYEVRFASALPHTERLPKPVRSDEDRHALRCGSCDGRHGTDRDGMQRAIECCSWMEHVSRDSVPICDLDLKLSLGVCVDVEPTTRQLLFLQAVYNAQRRRYEPPAYDLLRDSMTVLGEYVGMDAEAVEDLVEPDLLVQDTDYPPGCTL